MRSHLVYVAKQQVPNRFELVCMAARAARIIHEPGNLIGTSINHALLRIGFPEVEFTDGKEGEMN